MSLLSIVESPLIYIIVDLFSNIDEKEKLNIAMINCFGFLDIWKILYIYNEKNKVI